MNQNSIRKLTRYFINNTTSLLQTKSAILNIRNNQVISVFQTNKDNLKGLYDSIEDWQPVIILRTTNQANQFYTIINNPINKNDTFKIFLNRVQENFICYKCIVLEELDEAKVNKFLITLA